MTNRHNKNSHKPRDGTEIFSKHKGFNYQCFKDLWDEGAMPCSHMEEW